MLRKHAPRPLCPLFGWRWIASDGPSCDLEIERQPAREGKLIRIECASRAGISDPAVQYVVRRIKALKMLEVH